MSQHSDNKPFVKNFTFTSILSFSVLFVLFFLFSKCHGDYKKSSAEHETKTEQYEAPHH